jgi:hypothetical protein
MMRPLEKSADVAPVLKYSFIVVKLKIIGSGN